MSFSGELNQIAKRMERIEANLRADALRADQRSVAAQALRERICEALGIGRWASEEEILGEIHGLREYSEEMRARLERLGKEWEGPFEAIAAMTWADWKRWKRESAF